MSVLLSAIRPGDQLIGPSGTTYIVLEVDGRYARLLSRYPTRTDTDGLRHTELFDQVALDRFEWKALTGGDTHGQ